MTNEINRFTAHTNCPTREYLSIFTNSEVVKYPKGERQILTFLILNKEGSPFINNQNKPYYSVIVCNKTKGISANSKLSKIKVAMLDKKEYDPIKIHIGLPPIENFYDRQFRVLISSKKEDYNFITHIQRPRDLEWEKIEMEYQGGFIKDPRKLYSQLRYQIPYKKRDDFDQAFEGILSCSDGILLDELGNFKHQIDYNSVGMWGPESVNSYNHKKILKFLETQDLSTLFNIKAF